MKIKDLKKGDIAYQVFDNGVLQTLHCVKCSLFTKLDNKYEIIFSIDNYKGIKEFYQDGNENYIMLENSNIFLNKEDAIDELECYITSCKESINQLLNDK